MKKIIISLLIFFLTTACSYSESLVCSPLQGVMTSQQMKSFSKVNGKGKVFINIFNDKVIVSNDSDKIKYNIGKNNKDILDFFNITPLVFEVFSYYKETGILYYSKHSLIDNYASLYKTTCQNLTNK